MIYIYVFANPMVVLLLLMNFKTWLQIDANIWIKIKTRQALFVLLGTCPDSYTYNFISKLKKTITKLITSKH